MVEKLTPEQSAESARRLGEIIEGAQRRHAKEHYLESHRHPEVYGPDDPLPEPGRKEPFFLPGGILTLAIILGILGLHVWLAANGYGGLKTVIAHFIFG